MKYLLSTVLAALGLATTQAVPITGGIGFTGAYVIDGTDLETADSITFLSASVTGVPSGDFAAAGIAPGTPVTLLPSIDINNPPGGTGVTLPVGTAWEVGGFSFVLETLNEVFNNPDVLVLSGTGTISAAGFDPTAGTWLITLQDQNDPGSFTWSSSSAADGGGSPGGDVPDGGATAALLALGMATLVYSRRK